MKHWLKVVWDRRPSALLRKRGMFILDFFEGHLTPDVKKTAQDLNTDLVDIPEGMTSQLQVLYVAVNKPFKDNLKALYSEWLVAGDHDENVLDIDDSDIDNAGSETDDDSDSVEDVAGRCVAKD
ncbi:hypothetical protein PR048_029925 [Dryococelus australis]|uniref:DDE-1 domain-containing protein n=1 Tax=Dryococelus australis TaxID=614101 RepID=A0ABQ9GBE7_9NEOP|nr:hypothetical protein PR048_029925 [Dryococelus australis]